MNRVTLFAVLALLCAPSVALSPVARAAPASPRYHPAQQCFCALWWSNWTAVMDRDIAREKAGDPPQSASMTWPEFWSFVVATTAESYPDGAPSADHSEYYAAYIVQRRHAAGLPDLPDHPYARYVSIVIPSPTSDAITATPTVFEWAQRLCVATRGDAAAAHAAAVHAGWLRMGPETSAGVIGLRELGLQTGVNPPGLQSCTIDDSAPDPQESNLAALNRAFGRPPTDIDIGSASWSYIDDPNGRRFLVRGANPAEEADRAGIPAVTVRWEVKSDTPSLDYARFAPAGSPPPPSAPAPSTPAQSASNFQVDAVRQLCFATQGNPTRALALADEAGWRDLADLHFTRDKPDEASDRRQPPVADINTARRYVRMTELGSQWLGLDVLEANGDFGGRTAFIEECSVLDITKRLSGGRSTAPAADLQAALQTYFGRPPAITDEGVAIWVYEDRVEGRHYLPALVHTLTDAPAVIVALKRDGDTVVILYERIEPAG